MRSLAVLALLFLFPGVGRTQEPASVPMETPVPAPLTPVMARSPRHFLGFGSSIGGGYFVAKTSSADVGGPTLIIGDLSVYIGLSRTLELQVWLPLFTMVLGSVALHATTIWTDVFLKIYPGGNGSGFFVAPGIGFWYLNRTDSVGNSITGNILELPVRVGYELSSDNRAFSVGFSVRPWIDLLFAHSSGGSSGTALGYGGIIEVSFTGYFTRRD